MSLIACVNAYNEERMLPGCLESVAGVADRIVVVDGAYQHFPHTGVSSSTDATRQIAKCYGAEWVACPKAGWATQMVKRTAYLMGEAGDWYLVIDADERLEGHLPNLSMLDPLTSYKLRVVWADASMRPWAVRLFPHQPDMCYRGAHCALFAGDRLISRIPDAEPILSAYLLHLKDLRIPQRQALKLRYYAWQNQAERAFREAVRI